MSTSPSSRRPDRFLDPARIRLARTRRGLGKADLARRLSITPRTITRYESDGAPLAATDGLVEVLGFPAEFFTSAAVAEIDDAGVNFRAARRATARTRRAAVAAGAFGIEVNEWLSHRFVLPSVSVPVYSGEDPELAARLMRAEWGLGTRPLPNLVQLIESRGVRVYTLPTIADEVDAYSTWHGETPFVFLARRRTPEGVRFDAAHELGHLVLHPAGCSDDARQEREADAFASEFLVPADAIPEYLRPNPTIGALLAVRSQFKVSAMALAHAVHKAGRMGDWAYRQTCITLSGRGFRSSEPGGMPAYEMSQVFSQVLRRGRRNVTAHTIAHDLHLPIAEIQALTFGVELRSAHAAVDAPARHAPAEIGQLRVIGR